ncbi:MAG TPA: glycosyltransferase [Pyrinomonadaceae bacterium]|nr:glycosyltransferase [Pyrinomonadaceae bacterium]
MTHQLKSVHITNYYHKNSGGISTSYNNLLAAAERRERYISLIVPGEREEVEEVNPFAKIYYVPAKQSPIFDKRYRVIMPWQYMVKGSVIRRILLAERPDMIEVTDKYTLSMIGPMIRMNKFKKIGRPMLVHFSCERMDDNIASFWTHGRAGRWLARRIMGNYNFPNFDFHIANSAYTAEEFYESVGAKNNKRRSSRFMNTCWRFFKAPRVPVEDRIFVCPRGVDTAIFTPDHKSAKIKQKMREIAGAPGDAILLLYAGRISPEKNVKLLVEMMRILAKDSEKDFRLLVAGDGPKSEWLKNQTDRLFPGKIVQLGHLSKDELAGFYTNADIFVHPNPKEPFGIAPLEAMASGVPTVAPNSGGILSYATNENAWLVEPRAKEFASAVRDVIVDPVATAQKVQSALETARANTREASTDNLIATYDKIYDDFCSRNELFTDVEAVKEFDFMELVKIA